MKKSILTIAIASFLVACNTRPAEDIVSVKQNSADTAGRSEFEKWKNDQELIAGGEGLGESFETAAPIESEKAAPAVIYKSSPARATVAKASVAKAKSVPVRKRIPARQAVSRPNSNTGNSGGSGNSESTAGVGSGSEGSGSGSSLPSEAPVEKKNEGWSKAAKGTVIGGASGAVLGAIISKDKKGKGAVIGAVVGAAGGYVLGRSKDKKDGRY